MTIGILGLGAMGRALVNALVSAGHDVIVWNRTPGKDEGLGARTAASALEAIEASDVSVLCLLDDASVRETLAPIAPKLSGRLIVNLTSGSAQQARELGAWITGYGVRFLAGGIMAVPFTIATEGAFILYSGPRELFDEVASPLAPMARPQWVGEDLGFAALYDMAALSGMYGMSAGVGHAVRLVHEEGGDVEAFRREVLGPWMEQMFPIQIDGASPSETVPEEYNAQMQAVGLQTMIDNSAESGVPEALTGHLSANLWAMRRSIELTEGSR
jgi:3-hydroxyisobutyrate dehydrogenase-like beta-hydroxyacid dehydrogenase